MKKDCSQRRGSVPFHVERQMIRTGESSVTQMTFEGFCPRVFPVVSCQLVRPGKLPTTTLPSALVGFFTSVGSHVGFQVGALGVNLQ